MAIKLSIATAVYNLEEKYLRAHIENIRSQLTSETELLLINDCSTNNSGEVCEEYAEKYKHIRYIKMGKNGGLSAVRNRSIAEAQGKWLFFADGDDLLSEHFVESALKFYDSDADIIIHERMKFTEIPTGDFECPVTELTLLPSDAGRTLSISCLCLDPNIAKTLNLSKRAFYHAAWGALYNREFLVNNDLKFPVGQKKAQDAVFNTETYFHAKKIAYLPHIMYYYRVNPGGITQRYSKDLAQILKSLLELLSADKDKFFPDDEDVQARFQNHRVVACAVDNMRLNIFHKDNPKPKDARKQEFLAFIDGEPYKTAIENFDPYTYNRCEWLFTVDCIRNKNFKELDRVVDNSTDFRIFSSLYKYRKKLINKLKHR